MSLARPIATSASSPSTTPATPTPGTGSAVRSPTRTGPIGPRVRSRPRGSSRSTRRPGAQPEPRQRPLQASGRVWLVGPRDRQAELTRRWQELDPRSNPAGPGDLAGTTYGEMGRYAQVINPRCRLSSCQGAGPVSQVFAPGDPHRHRVGRGMPLGHRFRLRRAPRHHRPGTNAIRRGGRRLRRRRRRQARPLPLFRRERASGGARRPFDQPRQRDDSGTRRMISPSVTTAQPGRCGRRLRRRRQDRPVRDRRRVEPAIPESRRRFEDVTSRSGIAGPPAVSLTARWLDLDQDGDLDLYVVNHASAQESGACFGGGSPAGLPNAAYRNDGKPPAIPGRPRPTGHPWRWHPRTWGRRRGCRSRSHAGPTLMRSAAALSRIPRSRHSTSTTTATSTWSSPPTGSRSGLF